MTRPLDDDTRARGLDEFLAWGPALDTPVERRLAARLPELAPEELAALLAEFRGLERRALELAEAHLAAQVGQAAALQELGERCRGLGERSAARLWTQALWHASK